MQRRVGGAPLQQFGPGLEGDRRLAGQRLVVLDQVLPLAQRPPLVVVVGISLLACVRRCFSRFQFAATEVDPAGFDDLVNFGDREVEPLVPCLGLLVDDVVDVLLVHGRTVARTPEKGHSGGCSFLPAFDVAGAVERR